ncbi:MAG: hypothetical protein RLY93_01405 [Sumerlaeia bacterium]
MKKPDVMLSKTKRLTRMGVAALATAAAFAAFPAVSAASADYEEALIPRESLAKAKVAPTHPVISDDLLAVVEQLKAAASRKDRSAMRALASGQRSKPLFRLAGENLTQVEVYVLLREKSAEIYDELAALGLEVRFVSPSRPLLQGYVDIQQLENLAEHPAVRRIRRPSYAQPTSGEFETQGDSLQGTRLIRPVYNLDGSGVSVGVLSTSLIPDSRDYLNLTPLPDIGDTTIGTIADPDFSGGGEKNFDDECSRYTPFVPIGLEDGMIADGGNFLLWGVCQEAHFSRDLPLAPCGSDLSDDLALGSMLAVCANRPFGFYGGIEIFPATYQEHLFNVAENLAFQNPFPEGQAILEVLYDIAPEACYFYADGSTDLQVELGREFLRRRNVDTIVDNLIFTDAGRYDGSSFISRGATEFARTENVPYFVTGGAYTEPNPTGVTRATRFPMFVVGYFNPDPLPTRTKVHSWSTGIVENRDEALNINPVPSNGSGTGLFGGFDPIIVTLVYDDLWDDSDPRATDDLDLYLVPRSTLRLDQAVARSTNIQNGASDNPVERLVYFPVEGQPLSLVMTRKDQRSNARTLFTLVIESGQVSESQYLTHGVPTNNADALEPVVSVGHIDSSQSRSTLGDGIIPGLTPQGALQFQGQFLQWYHGQQHPTVVGYASVDTYSSKKCSLAGIRTERSFVGPSAAVAHLGGFAMLLRERYPNMPTSRFGELFRNTSDVGPDGQPIVSNARNITPELTEIYENNPVYLRADPLAIFSNLESGVYNPYVSEVADDNFVDLITQPTVDSKGTASGEPDLTATNWTPGQEVDLGSPKYGVSEMGLEITPGTAPSWGFWESPLLNVRTADGSETTQLRADRVYVAEARIGSTEADPLKVPDFRLRLSSGTGEESIALTIAGLTEDAANPPTSVGGKLYRVYYRPSNQAVADQGVRFSFEVTHFTESDNGDTTLILRDLVLKEVSPESLTNLR